jgi:hypothetical protein
MRRALLHLALLALLAGCGASRARTRPDAGHPAPGPARFVQQLAVLRRPARPSDTTPALRAVLARRARLPGCLAQVPEPGLTRRVRPGIYLVVFGPARCVLHCIGTGRMCARPQPTQAWATLIPARGLQPAGDWTSAELAAGGAFGWLEDRTVLLVPDGVAKVGLGTEVLTVRQNVVFVAPSASAWVRWLDASGRVIRRYVL